MLNKLLKLFIFLFILTSILTFHLIRLSICITIYSLKYIAYLVNFEKLTDQDLKIVEMLKEAEKLRGAI